MRLKSSVKRSAAIILTAVLASSCFVGCNENYKGISVNTNKYVKLGEYKGLEVEVNALPPTDEVVQQELEKALSSYGEYVDVTDHEEVRTGDTVSINFKGLKDGVAFQGGTAEDYIMTIGASSMIPGFEEGIIGRKVGEEFSVDLSFPDSYHEESLAGQPVVFEMKVNKIMKTQLPELTDEFIAGLNIGFQTADDIRTYISEYIMKQYESEKKTAVWDAVCKNCEIKSTPEEMNDTNYTLLMEEVEYSAQTNYNISLEEYIKQCGYSAAEFEEITREKAQKLSEETLICYAIAKKEGLTVTEEDIKKYADDNASTYGCADGTAFLEQYGEDAVERYLMTDKVQLFLIDNAVIINKESK